MKKLEKTFKALANKKRLEILKFLYKSRKASVGEIADMIKTSIKSASKHLLILYHAELLDKERSGGLTMYKLNDKLGEPEGKLMNVVRRN